MSFLSRRYDCVCDAGCLMKRFRIKVFMGGRTSSLFISEQIDLKYQNKPITVL